MEINNEFRIKSGSDWQLRDIQVQALRTLAETGRGFFSIGVGGGKTLLAMLIPEVLGVSPDEVLVLTTADLRDEAKREYGIYSQEFDIPFTAYQSYSTLSRNRDLLERTKPKVIICDEVHKLKNPGSNRTRAFINYCKDNPDVIFVPMTGTLTTTSILDYVHLLALAVGRENMPLPDPWKSGDYNKLQILARVLDPFPEMPPDSFDYRTAAWLLNKGEEETFREAYFRMLSGIPGVVISEESAFDGPLAFAKWKPKVPHEVNELYQSVLKGVLPNGRLVLDQSAKRNKRSQTATGFYYYNELDDEVHTPYWRRAKRELNQAVQEVVKREKRKRDGMWTEPQVFQAIERGEFHLPEYETYMTEFKDVPDPPKMTEWVDDSILIQAVEYCKTQLIEDRGSLLWYDNEAIRERARSLFADDPQVVVVDPKEKPPRGVDVPVVAIVSKYSHSTGVNLQHDYRHNLDLTPNSNAGQWEQWLGRTHRPGQTFDVLVDVNDSFAFFRDKIYKAKEKARYVLETTRQQQKLLIAEGV